MENEIFKRCQVDLKKIRNYGFKKEKENYIFSKNFLNNQFKAVIIVDHQGILSSKVYDNLTSEEYNNINFAVEGKFVNSVREAYKYILNDIKEKCFIQKYFLSEQANRIVQYIIDKYGNKPEFLWDKFPYYGVFKKNNKWYAIIMNIDKSKITNDSGEVEIINLKVLEKEISKLLNQEGFYKAYHMNKKSWITIILDDTVDDKIIFDLIDNSYNLLK